MGFWGVWWGCEVREGLVVEGMRGEMGWRVDLGAVSWLWGLDCRRFLHLRWELFITITVQRRN